MTQFIVLKIKSSESPPNSPLNTAANFNNNSFFGSNKLRRSLKISRNQETGSAQAHKHRNFKNIQIFSMASNSKFSICSLNKINYFWNTKVRMIKQKA